MRTKPVVRVLVGLTAISLGAGIAAGFDSSGPHAAARAQNPCLSEFFYVGPSCPGVQCPGGTTLSPTALPPIDFLRMLPRPGCPAAPSYTISVMVEHFGCESELCSSGLENGLYRQEGGLNYVRIATLPNTNPQVFSVDPGNTYRYVNHAKAQAEVTITAEFP